MNKKFDFDYDEDKYEKSTRYRLECDWKQWALNTSNIVFVVITLIGCVGIYFSLSNDNILMGNLFCFPLLFGLMSFRAKYWMEPKTTKERFDENIDAMQERLRNPDTYRQIFNRCPSCNQKLPKYHGSKCPYCTADF